MQPVLLNMSYHVMPRIILGFLNPSEYAVEGDKHKANGNINGFAWLSFTFLQSYDIFYFIQIICIFFCYNIHKSRVVMITCPSSSIPFLC